MPAISGFFTDYQHTAWLNQLFAKASYTVPTQLYIGLSMTRASRIGSYSEPTGGGYARVALNPSLWATASNGSISNVSPITFPASTGDWGTVKSMFLTDAPIGGGIIAMADLTAPVTVANGDSPKTFAPGSILISRS